MGGKSGSMTVGFKYFMGVHMGVSRGPVNEMVQINIGDKPAWPDFVVPESTDNSPVLDDDIFNALTEINLNINTSVNYSLNEGYQTPSDAATAYIYARAPSSWEAESWIKITGFKKSGVWGEIDLDGVYQIRSNVYQGDTRDGSVVQLLTLIIPQAKLADWMRFVDYTTEGVAAAQYTLTRVRNAAGDPWLDPNLPPDPGSDDWRVRESKVVQIKAPNLFGGETAEGGVEGALHVMMGEPTQVAPADLVTMAGQPQPGFRRMFTAFFNGMICAMNPYPKAWKFRVRRTTEGWDGPVFMPSIATIVTSRPMKDGEVSASGEIHAMNPAHIVYECLTNREWGRGLPESALNVPSFERAAQTLFNESFGLCLRWTRSDTIEAFVQGVLDHIGATLYQDPVSALLTLKLIRGGYVIEDLPLFEPGRGLLSVTDAPVASAGSYVNALRVTWHDPIHDEEQSTTVHNLASLQASGGVFNMVTKTYSGIPTADLAQRVAQRDLQTLGLELRKLTVQLDRSASSVRPGDVIRVRDLSRSIRETLLRVASYDDGTITNGVITVVGVQDVFDLPRVSFTGGQSSGWKPPTVKACIGRNEVFELPYVVYARYLRPADLAYITEETGRIGSLVEQGQPGNVAYRMAIRTGAPTPDDTPVNSDGYCGYVPPAP